MQALPFVSPTALSGAARNVVVARVYAGHVNRETPWQVQRACRAAARQHLGRARLTSAQAVEVDQACAATLAALAGQAVTVSHAAPGSAALVPADEARVLSALARIERLLMALVALLADHLGARRPVVVEASSVEPSALPCALPALSAPASRSGLAGRVWS